ASAQKDVLEGGGRNNQSESNLRLNERSRIKMIRSAEICAMEFLASPGRRVMSRLNAFSCRASSFHPDIQHYPIQGRQRSANRTHYNNHCENCCCSIW